MPELIEVWRGTRLNFEQMPFAMNLRLFCALPVPVPVQNELAQSAEALKAALSPATVSWVNPRNLHLTLSFLGDVEQSRVNELGAQLQAACADVIRFNLVCQGLGCFPNLNRPRVLWAGVASGRGDLLQLQNQVSAACLPFAKGVEKDRFHGHITLGRFRPSGSPSRRTLSPEIDRNRDIIFGRWEATEVQVVCSDLSQGVPRYSILHRIPLIERRE